MHEQAAVLVRHQDEWVLVIEHEEGPELVWQDLDNAMESLGVQGWHIAEGPGIIRPSGQGFPQIEVLGYRLRHGVQ